MCIFIYNQCFLPPLMFSKSSDNKSHRNRIFANSNNTIYKKKTAREEAIWQLHKNIPSNIKQVLAATPHKALSIRPPTSHHENYPS